MLKKCLFTCLLVLTLTLSGCSANNSFENPDNVMTVTVTNIEDNTLEVKSELYDQLMVDITESNIFDQEGNKLSKSDIAIDDTLNIETSGMVTRSMPPQTSALNIEK